MTSIWYVVWFVLGCVIGKQVGDDLFGPIQS